MVMELITNISFIFIFFRDEIINTCDFKGYPCFKLTYWIKYKLKITPKKQYRKKTPNKASKRRKSYNLKENPPTKNLEADEKEQEMFSKMYSKSRYHFLYWFQSMLVSKNHKECLQGVKADMVPGKVMVGHNHNLFSSHP